MSWNRHVNVGIAKSHQFAGQLIGMQLAIANVLAQIVSAASVVAGATMLSIQQFPSAWPLWIAAAGIGSGLALLIEGLTLGALIRVRVAGRTIHATEQAIRKSHDAQRSRLPVPDPADPQYALVTKRVKQVRRLIEREYQRTCKQALRQARRDRRSSLILACGSCLASMCGGGLFYHAILRGLGPLASIALSAVFTLAVTGTFVSSEVFKDLQEQAIRENFVNGNLAESAMRQETRMQSLWAVSAQIGTYLESPEAQHVIAQGGKLLVTCLLDELHQDLRQFLTPARPPVSQSVVENLSQIWPGLDADVTPRVLAPEGMGHEGPHETISETDLLFAQDSSENVAHNLQFLADSRSSTHSAEPSATSEPVSYVSHELSIADLDSVERALVSALERATPEERKELLKLARTQSLAAFTQTLQTRYPGYGSFFTEERVARALVVVRQTTPTKEIGSASAPGEQMIHLRSEPGASLPDLSQAQNTREGILPSSARVSGTIKRATIRHSNGSRDVSTIPSVSPGKRTHRARIKAAMAQAQQQGVRLNYRQLAQAAEVSYSTVKRHAPGIGKELLDDESPGT